MKEEEFKHHVVKLSYEARPGSRVDFTDANHRWLLADAISVELAGVHTHSLDAERLRFDVGAAESVVLAFDAHNSSEMSLIMVYGCDESQSLDLLKRARVLGETIQVKILSIQKGTYDGHKDRFGS